MNDTAFAFYIFCVVSSYSLFACSIFISLIGKPKWEKKKGFVMAFIGLIILIIGLVFLILAI